MRDLEAIDEQLRALGEPPADRAALLSRVLGTDRSRDRLADLLDEIAAAAPEQATPEAEVWADDAEPDTEQTEDAEANDDAVTVASYSRDTIADRDTVADPPRLASEDDGPVLPLVPDDVGTAPALRGGAMSISEPSPAKDEGSGFAAMFDFTNPPPPRESEPIVSAPPIGANAPRELESPFELPRDARSAFPEPLDEEPTGRRSAPPAPAPAAAADDDSDAEEASDSDFELLVDDEDIIEIDDEEMQIVDDE